ncbi:MULTISPECIES: acyl carrier protein [Peptoniphilaceae]|jgi:phosphopantetheine attachment domain protein|uniref:Putative acyl carrier protein IacP n=1 Tax=Peptoniphilus gorbachii TaxID=411567 RepID=A0A6N3CHY6_9FIRM|nr:MULTISPECIES: acyl carrier protein [Peptoniphilus]MDU5377681.1 acyl carrier protein [Peptoniphilus lacydonensis]MDU5437353.1 acyl carrier protein [Peptoniphilus lacydonensis]MDU5595480.1 acyl carrier protein [Peptoniphilus rhinitidis]MDU7303239.1 acyl carrier protein [Peptoniphilus lacydonensis]
MNINDRVKKILTNTIDGIDINNLTNSEQLITTGYIDSFDIIRLMEYFENEFCIKIDIEKVTLADFETVESMSNLILGLKENFYE